MKGYLSQLILVITLAAVSFGDDVTGQAVSGNRKVGEFIPEKETRLPRSLLSSFPTNQGNRVSRQRDGANGEGLDIGTIAAAGERCIDKVVMVEETEYDDEITCKHSYSERCHVTYKTDYTPQQEEECEENYKKKCHIEFKNFASEEKVTFCHTPLVKNCNIPGPEECTTEYKSECTTRYHEHEVEEDTPNCREEQEQKCQEITQGYTTSEQCTFWPTTKCTLDRKVVKKYSPETQCRKVPFELCGPSACPVEPGPEECFDKKETIVQEVPEEQCSLEPQKECKQVTKLVPLLKPAEECVDIPKEVCVRQRKNPRRVQKPIVKKWCYTPTVESGLITPPPRPRTTTRRPPTRRPTSDDDFGNSNQGQGNQRPDFNQPPILRGCNPRFPVNYCPARKSNRRCDPECNTAACDFDGGDCLPPPTRPPTTTTTTRPPRRSCARNLPADFCPQRSADGICNLECNTRACGYDGGDCQVKSTTSPPRVYLPPRQGY